MTLSDAVWNSIAGGFVASTAISALFFQVLKWRLERDLEKYKNSLSSKEGQAVEHIRTEAAIAAERFKKSFGLMADRQAEVVETIYLLLVDIQVALQQCLSPFENGGEQEAKELYAKLSDARWKGYSYFRRKRLFLPHEIGAQIDQIFSKFSGIELKYRFTSLNEKKMKDWDRINTLSNEVDGPIANMLTEIEKNFRILLSGERV